MSDFLSRLAERAQGRTQVAEPLIPSRFAASPWPTVGDVITPVREEYPERGPAPASDRNDPLPEPQEPTQPEEQLETGVETLLHGPMWQAQDWPTSRPATRLPEGLNSPIPPSAPATAPSPPPAASDSEGAAEGQPTSPNRPHPEAGPVEEETEGGGNDSESRRRIPEGSQKPSSTSHIRAEYIDKLPPLMPREQDPSVPDQHGRRGDAAEGELSPAVKPSYRIEARPASSRTGADDLQDESPQRLPTSATEPLSSPRIAAEHAPEEEEARTSTEARRVADRILSRDADRQHGTGSRKLPEDGEGYTMSGVEVLRTPYVQQVSEEASAPTDGGLPSIDPRTLRGERVGGQSPEPFAREPSWSQVPWVEQVEGRRSTQPAPSPPSVRVIIGRVEVRAIQPQPEARSSNGPRGPRVTLDDYLKERSGGGS